jgi:hypothetical protein
VLPDTDDRNSKPIWAFGALFVCTAFWALLIYWIVS